MKRIITFFILLILTGYCAKAELSQYPTPTNLSATNILYNDATLTWNNSSNALYWIVSYNVSQSSYVNEQIVSTNTLQINGLVSGVTYNWKVRMIDSNNDTTDWSNVATFQTLMQQTDCNPISQLTINAMGTNGITVQWVADSTQTQWEVVYGELGSNPEYDGGRITTSNYYCIIPSNALTLNSWYQIAVRNLCQGSYSGWTYINVRYIANQSYDLPVQQTFENDIQNSIFGFVNGTLNPWILGNAFNSTIDGNNSIYISTDAGQTNNYYPSTSAISYAYIDVMIPSYATSFYLDFKWKCLGQNSNDGMKVYLMADNTALDINQLPNSSNQIGLTFYNNNTTSTWQSEHIEIPAEYVGQVRRVVFAWINDASLGGEGGAIVDDIYITARYCATPTTPTHNYVTSSSAFLSWNFSDGQEDFNIQYRKLGASQWSQVNLVTSNYLLQNLDDNSTYIYRVQADCGMEQSFFSVTDTFTTLIQCLPPENIHTISYKNNNAIISWNDDSQVTKWIFEYGIDNGDNTVYNDSTIYSHIDTLNNLTPDTYYNVRIRAISFQNDTSRYSNIFTFHTLCNTVNQFPFNDLSDSITWNNVNGYSNQNSCWEIKGDTLLSPIFDFTNLGYPEINFQYSYIDSIYSFTKYKILITTDENTYYNVRNLNQVGNNFTLANQEIPTFSNEEFIRFAFVPQYYFYSIANFKIKNFQIKDICKSPEEIILLDISSNTATIDWASYSNNQSWDIAVIDTNTYNTTNYIASSHPYQITNLLPNTSYRIKLKSNCGNNLLADNWTELVFTTNSELNCITPINLSCTHYVGTKADETIVCTWDALEGQTLWQLEYKQSYAVDWNRVSVSTNPHYSVRNLELENAYMFRVRAVCSEGDTSNWTDTVNVNLSSLEDEIDYDSQIKIYPNPVKELLNIETLSNDFGITKLINQNGQIVGEWEKLPKSIDISRLAAGNYFLQINAQTIKITKKVIVIR